MPSAWRSSIRLRVVTDSLNRFAASCRPASEMRLEPEQQAAAAAARRISSISSGSCAISTVERPNQRTLSGTSAANSSIA